MKIKINLNIFLFLLIFFITNQLEIYTLIMIFALLHEMSHLCCGIIVGFKVEMLKIMPLGFAVEFKTNIEDYNRKVFKSNILSVKKIIIALAGPICNFLIIILAHLCNWSMNIIYSNLLLLLFNMIPIYPLDGGKILKNILKIFCGNRRANKYTNNTSNIFIILLTMLASILIIAYKNIAILMLIIVLWSIVIKENKIYNTYNKIYKTIDKINNCL